MAKKAQLNRTDLLPPLSEPRLRLAALLARLTGQQQNGITRIIEAEIVGLTLDSLLAPGPGQMCAHSTYYGPGGWSHKPDFVEALRLARQLSFDDRLQSATRRARERIVMAAPAAADRLVESMSSPDGNIALRAAESVLNRTDKTTAVQSAVVVVTGDDLAAARDEAERWEKERFTGGRDGLQEKG